MVGLETRIPSSQLKCFELESNELRPMEMKSGILNRDC